MVVSEGAINNIMGGMENTAGVRLHSHRHKLKQRFDIIRKLGQGTYGKVQLAINKETGQEVAIKTIKKAKIETEQDLVRIRREIQIMSSVQHPQIIHIYEVFENREKMVLVMEYAAGGELYDYLSERKVLNEPEARRIFRQVASAVYYCHKHKICHRDLKLENILLDLDGNAKIADFGLSNVFDEKHRLDTFCGSPLYASPEIVKGTPYIGPEVDCWSLGVLLYTLVYGAMPFDGSNFRRLVKQITQGDFYEPSTPATASELIRHMLTVQSTERASVEDICVHWWVNETYAESCLTEAEALASQTPVRLDLLLSLAPKHISSEHLVIQADDDDMSQRSDQSGAPYLKLPPPPPMEVDNENEAAPARSHSLGSLPPGSRMDIDLLLEKKRIDRKIEDDKKRRHEETPQVEKKKKKESVSKKPPSKPTHEDISDRKKVTDVEEKEERKKEEESKSLKKREPSVEKDISEKSEKRVARKVDPSSARKATRRKESKEETKPKPASIASKVECKPKKEEISDSKMRASSTPVSRGGSSSPTPSTDATLKASDSSISRKSISPVKTLVNKEDTARNKVNESANNKQPKADSIVGSSSTKKEKASMGKDIEVTLEPIADVAHKDSTTKLIDTNEKVSEVKGEETPPSLKVSTSAMSTPNSVTSSQATTPARSRTGSESSTEARPSRSDSSRRQSKIFSKAAMFDTMVQGSKSPPPPEKPKKVIRPGTLNMSDLAKRFEEKQSIEKKKVVAPFKVSDARKTFESKADKSSADLSPRRKVSGVNSSGGESLSNSPRESLPTSPKESLPTSPTESLPTSPRESLPTSPRESLPTSPTRADKILPTSQSSSTVINKTKDVLSCEKSGSQIIMTGAKETHPTKEKAVSPPKESLVKASAKVHVKDASSNYKKERSPMPSSIKKEKSPSPSIENAQSKPVKVLSTSKVKDVSKIENKVEVKDKPKERTEKVKPVIKTDQRISKDSPSEKSIMVDAPKEVVKAKTVGATKAEIVRRAMEAKVDTSDSSDSESEAEKLLKFLSEKRERLEQAKKEKLKKVSESKEKEALAREMPPIKEEQRTTPPSKSPEKSRSNDSQSENKEKYATLPKGFKSKGVPISIVSAARINSVESSKQNDNMNKKSQVEIVLNNQQGPKKPIVKSLQSQKSFDNNKKSSFTEIHIATPAVTEAVRQPEFRTEVRHTVCSPEVRSVPNTGVEPNLHRAKRERIIPIMIEDDSGDERSTFNEPRSVTNASTRTSIQPSSSSSSKASSASSIPHRVTTNVGCTLPSTATEKQGRWPNDGSPDLIRKSRRERIIPIAVEGEGIITPPRTDSSEGVRGSFQRQGSGQSSFNRGRGFLLDRNESFSSAGEDDDEDEDDGFQILTAESLFSTLLNRVRSLTRKMTDEGTRGGSSDRLRRTPQPPPPPGADPSQPGGFWSSLYSVPSHSPARRISETLSRAQSREDSFGGFSSPVWGRSMSRTGSDAETVFSEANAPFSTLPRADFLGLHMNHPHSRMFNDPFFSDFTRT